MSVKSPPRFFSTPRDAPEMLQEAASRINDNRQISAGVIEVDDLDLDWPLEIDAEYAIKAYVSHSSWHRTNMHPGMYEQLNRALNEYDLTLRHMDTVHEDKDDEDDLIFTRLILTRGQN